MVGDGGGSAASSRTDYVQVAKHLLAGGIAGAVSRTVVSPLERLKILFQVRLGTITMLSHRRVLTRCAGAVFLRAAAAQVQGPGPATHHSVWGTLKHIWLKEGVVGYFKGNGTNIIRIAPYSAVQFAAYEKYKAVRPPTRMWRRSTVRPRR